MQIAAEPVGVVFIRMNDERGNWNVRTIPRVHEGRVRDVHKIMGQLHITSGWIIITLSYTAFVLIKKKKEKHREPRIPRSDTAIYNIRRE